MGEIEVDLTAADETRVKKTPTTGMQEKLKRESLPVNVRLRQQRLNTKIIAGVCGMVSQFVWANNKWWMAYHKHVVRKNNDSSWVATHCKRLLKTLQ